MVVTRNITREKISAWHPMNFPNEPGESTDECISPHVLCAQLHMPRWCIIKKATMKIKILQKCVVHILKQYRLEMCCRVK